jgi:hypothetical protein
LSLALNSTSPRPSGTPGSVRIRPTKEGSEPAACNGLGTSVSSTLLSFGLRDEIWFAIDDRPGRDRSRPRPTADTGYRAAALLRQTLADGINPRELPKLRHLPPADLGSD